MLQVQALHDFGVHDRGKEAERIATVFFGAVHGGISILGKGLAVGPVFWEDTDSDTATDGESPPLNSKFSDHCVHDALGCDCGIGYIVDAGQDNYEFVAADSSHRVLGTGQPL